MIGIHKQKRIHNPKKSSIRNAIQESESGTLKRGLNDFNHLVGCNKHDK